VLYALEHAEPADRARLVELRSLSEPSHAEVVEVVAILERAGADAFTRSEARRHRDAALSELDGLAVVEPAAREKLAGIISSVISA
jgi:geranylgeranyl pyrophosphate synthase